MGEVASHPAGITSSEARWVLPSAAGEVLGKAVKQNCVLPSASLGSLSWLPMVPDCCLMDTGLCD